MEKCKYIIGLLNLRDCGEPAFGQCRTCGKGVCPKHGKTLEKEGEILCLDCRRDYEKKNRGGVKGVKDSGEGKESIEERRRDIYANSGYIHPFYFGRSGVFGTEDYTVFESGGSKGVEADSAESTVNGDALETGPGISTGEDKIKETDFQDS